MTREEWNRRFQKYVNMDADQLIYIARHSSDMIYESLKYGGYRARAKELFLRIFTSFAVLDGEVTEEEFSLFQRVTLDLFDDAYSYKDFQYYAKLNWKQNYLNDLSYALEYSETLKDDILELGLAICAIDEHILSPEIEFILHIDEY